MTHRFTIDGSPALERHLDRASAHALEGVRSIVPARTLEAVVLGGGYGRGEGGVLRTPSGDSPYNDLEFYVFTRGNRLWNERKYRPLLNQLGDRLSPDAGLHVEFKVDALDRLRRAPVTMFTYDLVSAHRVLGETAPDLFAGCEHHLDAGRIPVSEATRLLFNRCTGLLLAKELLRRKALNDEQSDFVGRNLAKAQLALGDVLLTALGRYHWSCRERRERVSRLESFAPERPGSAMLETDLAEIRRHHAAGADFKLHPRRFSKSILQFREEHWEISALALRVWLWLESLRLSRPFASAREYAFSPVEKCNGNPAWRNVLLNARTFRFAALFDSMAVRYPRERLLNSLPLLLWEEPARDLRITRHLQNQLRTGGSDWQSLVAAYKTVWPSFS